MTQDDTDTLVTRSGYRFLLRPVTARDEPVLAEFFRRVSADDLRFRFLTSVGTVSHDRLAAMIARAEEGIDSYLAVSEQGETIAAALLAGDREREDAEVAITVRSDMKGRGYAWRLLEYLVGRAQEAGYASIGSVEDRQNYAAVSLEREMGFATEAVAGAPGLVFVRRTLRQA